MNKHDMTEQAYKNGFEAGVKSQQTEIEQWKEFAKGIAILINLVKEMVGDSR